MSHFVSLSDNNLYRMYDLLPPPPRSLLSRAPEGVRDVLPDFTLAADPAGELRAWAHRIFYWNLDFAWPHMYAGTAIIGLLLLLVGSIFARRLWERSLWVVRFVRTPRGWLAIPNAIISFASVRLSDSTLLAAHSLTPHADDGSLWQPARLDVLGLLLVLPPGHRERAAHLRCALADRHLDAALLVRAGGRQATLRSR